MLPSDVIPGGKRRQTFVQRSAMTCLRQLEIRWCQGSAARASVWVLIAVTIACARRAPPVSAPAARAPVPAELRQRYTGTYVYTGGEGERAAVAAAVDRAVEEMSFLTRGFARSALM